MRTITLTSGPAAGETLELESETVIGREGADLTIADPELSRRHLLLRPVDEGVEVEDLGSLNGTFVNGSRIEGPVTLESDAKLRAGVTEIELAISISEPEPAPPEAPLAQPDVTAPRAIPQPDVTAPRAIPEPDVTAPRAIPQPDVTAPRAIPEPDLTAVRPSASPPEAAKAPPPTPPAPAAPAATAPTHAPDAGKPASRGLPPAALVALGILIGAAIAVLIVLLA